MRFPTPLLIAVALALVASSCAFGNGDVTTESRSVSAFDSVRVEGAGLLSVHGGAQKVEITSDSSILPYVTTTVSGSTLIIGFKPGVSIHDPSSLEYDITMPSLSGIELDGACDCDIDAFDYDSIRIALNGSGGASLRASANSIAIDLSGAGSVTASDLAAMAATVKISGVGSVALRVAKTLDATLSGVGDLSYWGSPAVSTKISGLGRVIKAGD
mgnify:CR=1 FL=1